MPESAAELLRQARDELFVLRAAIAPLRNRAKVAVAAIDDHEARLQGLIERIDTVLSTAPKEGHGYEPTAATHPEADHEVGVGEVERRRAAPGRAAIRRRREVHHP